MEPHKDLYVLNESNEDLKTNDPSNQRKKKLFSGPGLPLVNKAKILTAMAIADAKHDHTNQKGYLTYLMCEKQDSGIINNVKKRKEPKNFKEAGEDTCLESIFGKWPTDGSENNSYFNFKTDNTRDNNLRPSHSFRNIGNKYHIAIIGTDKSIDEWDHITNGPANRAEGWINMATQFKVFLQSTQLKSQNILYHCDAANIGWDHLKNILAPDDVSPFLMQTRASLTDPATKITEKTQDWLSFRHRARPNINEWGFLREKPDTELATSVVNSYVYNEVKDCNDNSVNESWLDTLVSKQKVTHKLEDYDSAYIKLEKKNRSNGATKTIYYDGFLSAKKIGATDIVLRNKDLYDNNITKVISGSHALAKRCGDWCQAIQTKREFKKANYEEYNGARGNFIDAGTEVDYDISENSVIQCLITHDRILKAYALTIGVPMVILTKQKRDQIGPSMEIYIDKSYSSRKVQLQNKFESIKDKVSTLTSKITSKAAGIDTKQQNLKTKITAIKRDISGVCIETKNLISATQLNGLNDPEEIKMLLSSGKDNFYYKFIVNIATLYHVLSTYTTAILEITNLAGNATDDLNARKAQAKTDTDYDANYQQITDNLPSMNDNDDAGLDGIEQAITNCESYIGKLENELSILNLAEAGLNNAKFNEIKSSVSIFTNDDKIVWCSPFKFLKRYGSRVALSCLTTSIPRKLCIEYIRKLSFIRQQLTKIFTLPQDMNSLLLNPNATIFKYYSDPTNLTTAQNGVDRDSPNPPNLFSLGIFFDYDSGNPTYFNARRRTNLSQYILLFNSVVSREYSDALGVPLSGGGKGKKDKFIQRGGTITSDSIAFGNNIASYMIIQRGYDRLEEFFLKTPTTGNVNINGKLEELSLYNYFIYNCDVVINKFIIDYNKSGNKFDIRMLNTYSGFIYFLQRVDDKLFRELLRLLDTLLNSDVTREIFIKDDFEKNELNKYLSARSLKDIVNKVRGTGSNPRGLNILTDLVNESESQLLTLDSFNKNLAPNRRDVLTYNSKISIISDKITFLFSYLFTNTVERKLTFNNSNMCLNEEQRNVLYIMEPTIRTDNKYIYNIKQALVGLTDQDTATALENPEICSIENGCQLLLQDATNDEIIIRDVLDERMESGNEDVFTQPRFVKIINNFVKKGYVSERYATMFGSFALLRQCFIVLIQKKLIECTELQNGLITLNNNMIGLLLPVPNGWKYKLAVEKGFYFVLTSTGQQQQQQSSSKKSDRSQAAKKAADTRRTKANKKASQGTPKIDELFKAMDVEDNKGASKEEEKERLDSIICDINSTVEDVARALIERYPGNDQSIFTQLVELCNDESNSRDESFRNEVWEEIRLLTKQGGGRKRKTKRRRKKRKKTKRRRKKRKKTKRRRKKRKKTRRKR